MLFPTSQTHTAHPWNRFYMYQEIKAFLRTGSVDASVSVHDLARLATLYPAQGGRVLLRTEAHAQGYMPTRTLGTMSKHRLKTARELHWSLLLSSFTRSRGPTTSHNPPAALHVPKHICNISI